MTLTRKEVVEKLTEKFRKRLELRKSQKIEKSRANELIHFSPPIDISKRDTRKPGDEFSYVRLINALRSGYWGQARIEKAAIEKALAEGAMATGGALVPPEHYGKLIERLTAKAVMRRAGVPVYPMQRDTMDMPKMTAGANTAWGSEAGTLNEDDAEAFGQVKLIARKLYCYVAISNELLADSSPAVEDVVRRDMAMQIAIAEDQAFIRGSGSGDEPLGLTGISGVNALPDVAVGSFNYDSIIDLISLVEDDNAECDCIITTPRLKNILRKIKDQNDQYVYDFNPQAAIPETLLGLPLYLTTHCRDAATPSTHFVLTGNFKEEAMIGERKTLQLEASSHFKFNTDQTVLRGITRVDFNVRHAEAFAKVNVTGVS